jgi:hypothetical protein
VGAELADVGDDFDGFVHVVSFKKVPFVGKV